MYVSAEGISYSHQGSSPARFRRLFDVDSYIRGHRSRFDSLRFATLPSHGVILVVHHKPGSRDAAVGACRNQ